MAEPIHRVFRIQQIIREGTVGATLVLDDTLPARPGQFVMAWLPGIDERPFGIMNDDPLSLTIAEVGRTTCALCALQVGEQVWIRGPLGHGFELSGERHLLVGGGSGAASLTLLAKNALHQGHAVFAALGARTSSRLMLPWRFQALGCPLILATDDGSLGYRGNVLDAIEAELAELRPDSLYACGPEPMLRALAERVPQWGLPCWVSLEREMKCGLGVCGNCHYGDKLVCKDGPVFALEDVL